FRTVTGISSLQAPSDISYVELLGFIDGTRITSAERKIEKNNSQQPRRKPKHSWSEEEDEGLVKGYQKHGFCWKDIANDPTLSLGNRSGPQIRDRFRKRFPELYGEVQLPVKETSSTNTDGNDPKAKNVVQPGIAQGTVGGSVAKCSKEDIAEDQAVPASMPKQPTSALGPHDINGLLNSEDNIRHPSFRDGTWDQNVTLAPLQWEDLCAKPMFDLD
ncbi:MAG: hypothetical protein Q9183_001110, partial [Haloplaca sp. 2 TL-2023]